MTRLRGRFDGTAIVLDEPPPPELRPNTVVEVLVPDEREQAVQEFLAFLDALWSRPLPADFNPSPRRWKREELYERGGKPLA